MSGDYYIGLMSGTSLDGLDMALVKISQPFQLEVIAFKSEAFEPALHESLLQAINQDSWQLDQLLAADNLLGRHFGDRIVEFLAGTQVKADEITAIGVLGITLRHCPKKTPVLNGEGRGTLQLGNAHMIREQTGIPVIFNFRDADMAAGGQGAPLAPFLDQLMFCHPRRGRVLLNLGGIANATFLPPGSDAVTAFDTGPGNMLIDALMRRHPLTPKAYDPEGRHGSGGTPNEALLKWALKHPFFAMEPPKSTGREDFGESFAESFMQAETVKQYDDLVATATELTLVSVSNAIRNYQHLSFSFKDLGEMIVGGGGAFNRAIMAGFKRKLPEMTVKTTAAFGLDPSAKEAVLSAALAWAYVNQIPANIPAVTGANKAVILGSCTNPKVPV